MVLSSLLGRRSKTSMQGNPLKALGRDHSPEKVLARLDARELASLLDALFQNLDTPTPHIDAEYWYELAKEESQRREISSSSIN